MLRTLQPFRQVLSRPDPRRVRDALELGLALLLAVQAGRLIWVFLTPLGPLGGTAGAAPSPAARDLTILARVDPFFRTPLTGPALDGPAPSTGGGFQLHGVRVGGAGAGSAILAAPDGRQASYAVGEEVAPGLKLAAVSADHVILARGATRLPVAFSTSGAPTVSVAPPAAKAPSQALGGLQPRVVDGQASGYFVPSGAGGEFLHRLGLSPGDVLTAVNGRTLDAPEKLQALAADLAGAADAELRFERAGKLMTLRARIPH